MEPIKTQNGENICFREYMVRSNLEAELIIQHLVQLTSHKGKIIYSYLKGLQ